VHVTEIHPHDGLFAVLDMGASAIRLVVAEVPADGQTRVLSEASRGVLLGRDSFSSGVLKPKTWEAALSALEGFREIIDGHGVTQIRAVATSAVREARNGEAFLDHIHRTTGIRFEIINEAEESRLVYLAVRDALGRHPVLEGAWTLLVEVGGGSTSLTLLERGQPSRSGVYALGAIRLRQQLDLRRHRHDIQVALLRRSIANVVEQIRLEIPLRRVTQMVAIGGDVRFAASEIAEQRGSDGTREVPREAFLAFCDEVERLDSDSLVSRFRLPAVEAETLMPSLLVYRTLLAETTARRVVVSDATLRAGVLLDLVGPGAEQGAGDAERQVLASAEAVGERFQFDREHGRHVAMLATSLFDELRDEHGLGDRDRLLLKTASLLHDIGIYVSLRGHHKHSQYLLAASQIFGVSDEETAVVSNIARYHRRGTPRRSHLPYVELDRPDRLLVNKLAAILRIANALDAEHLQKVKGLRLLRSEKTWVLELDGTGDVTMEQMAATARADMFTEVYGRDLIIRAAGVVG